MHTNTIEGYFSILKRVSPRRTAALEALSAEFDFRYNERSKLGVDDAERAAKLAKGIAGKRLTYRRPDSEEDAPSAN